MQSTPLLPSLTGLLWPRVVAPDRVLTMGQIEFNCILVLNWIVWISIVYIYTSPLAEWVGCLLMAQETGVQSQFMSYQRLKNDTWCCLAFSIIRCVSRVKWTNPGKEVVPSPTPWCSSFWKGSLQVTLNYSSQLCICIKMVMALNNLRWLICHKNRQTKPNQT